MMNNNRETWIDWSKFILITLMVLCHLGLPYGTLRSLIYAFHMPAFFIISGYLSRPKPIGKMIYRMVMPVLIISMVNFVWKVYSSPMSVDELLKLSLKTFFFRCGESGFTTLFPGLWFIWVLLVGRILLIFTMKYSDKKFLLINVSICASTFVVMELLMSYDLNNHILWQMWFMRTIPCYLFLFLGYCFKRWNFVQHLNWGVVFVLGVFIPLVIYNGAVDIFSYKFGRIYTLFVVNSLLGSLFVYGLSKYFCPSIIIQTFSKGTLLILGLHITIGGVVSRLLSHFVTFPSFITPWIVTFIVMVSCYYAIKFAEKYFRILLG